MSTVETQVAVIGNGPVGQSAALLLARWGVPVVVLDRRPRRDAVGSRSIVQQRDVLDIWEAVGAGRRIADEGLTWTVARTFYRDRELFSLTFAGAGRSPFPPFVNLSQARTERILDERIAASPRIDVRWDRTVTGITQDADGVTLTCAQNSHNNQNSQNGDNPVDTVRARYVLACAGARSDDVRRLLGVTFDGRSYDDRFLICDIRAELPGWASERRFYFDPPWNPGRQVLIHPCPDSTFRVDWQVPPDYDERTELTTGARDTRIRAVIGDRPYEVVWSSVYRFHSRLVDRMRVGRVLLAGDLAHVVAPFGARGLNSGVQDAENAAWKLAFVLSGAADERLLDSYHTERHAAARENLDVVGATMRFLVPGTEADRQRRGAALTAACADRTSWTAIDSGRLAEPFWYVDSPLTTLDPGRPFTGRPPRGALPPPGPGILLPDAPVSVGGPIGGAPDGSPVDGGPTTIRRLARDGFLLLAADGVDGGAALAAARRATRETAGQATAAPVRALALSAIDHTGALREALTARPGELWVVRPDAHVAAVLARPDPAAITGAVRRALGAADGPVAHQEEDHGVLPAAR